MSIFQSMNVVNGRRQSARIAQLPRRSAEDTDPVDGSKLTDHGKSFQLADTSGWIDQSHSRQSLGRR